MLWMIRSLRRAFDQFHEKIDHWIAKEKLPA